MKLFDKFDQTPPNTLNKIVAKRIPMKNGSQSLFLNPKVKVAKM